MATNDERLMILNMIQEGKISAEEGTRLLTAMGGVEENRPTGSGSTARFMRSWTRPAPPPTRARATAGKRSRGTGPSHGSPKHMET